MGNGDGGLQRQFGLLQATALNVTMIVGAGVFITIPLMLEKLPGPYALLGWLVAGVLILLDSLVWSELGATLPGSGGSYLYLLECYGRERWGRLMAFLFIWQFLLSGPLEIASGLIAMDSFSQSLSPAFQQYNRENTLKIDLWTEQGMRSNHQSGSAGLHDDWRPHPRAAVSPRHRVGSVDRAAVAGRSRCDRSGSAWKDSFILMRREHSISATSTPAIWASRSARQ